MNIEELKQRAKLTENEVANVTSVRFSEEAWEDVQKALEAQINKLLNQPLYFKIEKPLPEPDMDIHIWRDYSPDMAYDKCKDDMLQREKESYIPTGETKID